MAERDPNRQLDLLGAVERGPGPRGEKLAVRWIELDLPGKLGRAAWPGSGIGVAEDMAHLREQHRVGVLLAVADDPGPLLDPAAELGMDVRALRPSERGERLAQQAAALAADLRAGRRAVAVSTDAPSAALPVACALVRLGKTVAEAIDAVDGALDEARVEVLRELAHAPRGDAGSIGGDADETSVEVVRELAHAQHEGGEASSDGALGPEPHASADDADDARTESVDLAHPSADAADDARSVELGEVLRDDLFRRSDARSAQLDDAFGNESAFARVDSRTEQLDAATIGTELERVVRSPRASRLAGAVLGAAIGDAMGHPTEFIRSFDAIRTQYGPDGVTGYELWREDGARRYAPYTDDTQMAECVLRSLLWGRERGADLDETMRDLARRFVEWANEPQGGHRAPGNACLAGCRNLERGVAWSEAGGATAGGCGSVMRAYPFGLLFAHDLGRAEAWAVAHSKLTHRDPIALAASAAMAVGVARILRDEPIATVLSEMVAAACRYSPKTAAMMARAIDEAQEGVEPETTLERLEGWAAHEAIAAAVYLFARHTDDPRAAILEGANTPGDSDSLATLAGALTGARAGLGAIPADWVRDVERSDELLALALRI